MANVVICVSRSLSKQQLQLNGIVVQLGGDFKWTYDASTCTHLIAEPCSSSPVTELCSQANTPVPDDVRKALNDDKFVVQPNWLTDSNDQGKRLPEAPYLLSETNFKQILSPQLSDRLSSAELRDS
ncbi:DNA topoisomerase 2-binding protein 1, partial [Cichlidogyrus casuarinus]